MAEVVSWRGRRFEDPRSWDASMAADERLFEQLGVLAQVAATVDGGDQERLIA